MVQSRQLSIYAQCNFSDTVCRVGVYCSVVNVIEMCKTEGVVDVFQVVKALRIQKPGAVLTVVIKNWLPIQVCMS